MQTNPLWRTSNPAGVRTWLISGMVATLLGSIVLGYLAMEPYLLEAKTSPGTTEQSWQVPDFDLSGWRALPLQVGGRTKPLETAAVETLRTVTGRTRFEKRDPVAVFLMWRFTRGQGMGTVFPDWEEYPFILCSHHDLRKWIYAHKIAGQDPAGFDADEITPALLAKANEVLTEEERFGKYISPGELRRSPGFQRLCREADQLREEDPEHARAVMSNEQEQASEVRSRLQRYDAFSRNPFGNEGTPRDQLNDPLNLVNLDRVAGSGWFSLGQLRAMLADEKAWPIMMLNRMIETPERYLSPNSQAELKKFQDKVGKKEALPLIEALAQDAEGRLDREIARTEALDDSREKRFALEFLRDRQAKLSETMDDLRARVKRAQGSNYDPTDPRWKMLHLNYMETRFPNLYREAVLWQEFPEADARAVLDAYDRVELAYNRDSGAEVSVPLDEEAEPVGSFAEESEAFFKQLKRVSDKSLAAGLSSNSDSAIQEAYKTYETALTEAQTDEDRDAARDSFLDAAAAAGEQVRPYPGVDTIDLELTFNKSQPFMWAWILMLPAVFAFGGSYLTGSRLLYLGGFVFFAAALALEVFGFYCRIAISGRPPVSNMYETVIFVAFMASLFAVGLELVYRKGLIIWAGSLVSLTALVLADQVPTTLDPSLQPLTPVLRSNFWLIIHVLTIVSSYAGGLLAWGLANVSLGLLAFGNPTRETLKTLSNYTYRAMQIAVLLLAAGTFLGGWWAAYSWGRFWGWDPKETWALISLVCYVIPLHARYIGWVKDFGLAVAAVVCFAAILMCWYGVNFVLPAGLHSYGFGGGGQAYVGLAVLLNLFWVFLTSLLYFNKTQRLAQTTTTEETEASSAAAESEMMS